MSDERFMRIALRLAEATIGQTSPNPVVGAVIVKNGEIIGMGAHLKTGGNHAEVHAIDMAGDQACGATLYVTLEPCSYQGRTPPCTELIIKSGLQRVVIATEDLNKQVNGINQLQEAGIEVKTGVLKKEAEQMNECFFHYIQTKKPYVTLKTAMSLDGKIATNTGESKWITGEEARLDAHTYRRTHDAILVGVGTVIADNPKLTMRLKTGSKKNPLRIILDTHLRTPLGATVVTNGEAATWIVVGSRVSNQAKEPYLQYDHVSILQLDEKVICIKQVLDLLGEREVTSLLVEGGAEINGSFLQEKTFNQLVVYLAPMLIGGETAPTSYAGQGFAQLAESPKLSIKYMERLGEDMKIVASNKKEE